jgi:hypothetical protein
MKKAILIGSILLVLGSVTQSLAADFVNAENREMNPLEEPARKKERYYIMHASFLFGNIQDPESYFPARNVMRVTPSFTISKGYMINKNWAAGAGVGFEIFAHNFYPVFTELKYTWWDNQITPFVVFKGGYSFCSFIARHYDELRLTQHYNFINDVKVRHYGGLLVHPELGVKMPINEKSDLLFTVAYRFQKSRSIARTAYRKDYHEMVHNEEFNRLSFGIAILFR